MEITKKDIMNCVRSMGLAAKTVCVHASKANKLNWSHMVCGIPATWARPNATCNDCIWAQPSISNASPPWPKPKA